ACRKVGEGAEAVVLGLGEGTGQAARRGSGGGLGGDVEARRIGGADGGVDGGAGEGRVFQLGHQLVGRRLTVALESVHKGGPTPLAAGQGRRDGFGTQPGGQGRAERVQERCHKGCDLEGG